MNDIVKIEKDQVITTSYQIAKVFSKRHSDVLRDIKSLLGQVDDDFAKRNFAFCLNIDKLQNGKPQPYYTLTKDGFTLLAISYTGAKAMKCKIDYIQAFNQMQEIIEQGELSLAMQYNRLSLEFEHACNTASLAGRTLAIVGKQVKPSLKYKMDSILNKMQLQLPHFAQK